MPSERICTCKPGGMTPHEGECDYMAGFMTEREAAIFAYLYTIAEPPGPASGMVARHYLKEKLDWLRGQIKSGGNLFANLDPGRRRKALTLIYESGIISLERAAQAIGADPEWLREHWTPPKADVDALVEKIWERFIAPNMELEEGFIGAPVALDNVVGAAAAIVLRAMDTGKVPRCPVITGDAMAPPVPFVRVTGEYEGEPGMVTVTLEGPPWIATLMPEQRYMEE